MNLCLSVIFDYCGYDNSGNDNLPEVQNWVGAEQSSLHNLNTPQKSPNNSPNANNGANNSDVALADAS